MLNTLGLGLMYGLIYGAGVWAALHIGQRLQVAPYWVRTVLGAVVGGLIVAFGINLFQTLYYDDVIEPAVSIGSGILYVVGFAASVGLPIVMQIVLGSAGVALAFLIPWANYLSNPDFRPPFIFDEGRLETVGPLIIAAALIVAFVTFGYVWWQAAQREIERRHDGKPAVSLESEAASVSDIAYSHQHPAV